MCLWRAGGTQKKRNTDLRGASNNQLDYPLQYGGSAQNNLHKSMPGSYSALYQQASRGQNMDFPLQASQSQMSQHMSQQLSQQLMQQQQQQHRQGAMYAAQGGLYANHRDLGLQGPSLQSSAGAAYGHLGGGGTSMLYGGNNMHVPNLHRPLTLDDGGMPSSSSLNAFLASNQYSNMAAYNNNGPSKLHLQ